MATSSCADPSSGKAAQILREMFEDLKHGFTIRLWDGSEVELGRHILQVTVVFPTLKSFKRVILNSNVAEFAEAYCDGDIEFEGDLFEVMKVADSMDEIGLSFWKKIKIATRVKGLSK